MILPGARRSIPSKLLLSLLVLATVLCSVLPFVRAEDGVDGVDGVDVADDMDADYDSADMADMADKPYIPDMADSPDMEEMADSKEADTPRLPSVPYVKPSTAGLLYAELFERDWESRWIKSGKEKYSGVWERSLRKQEAIEGDFGLKVTQQARHYAIASKVPNVDTSKDEELILSFETKFEAGQTCGGAYLKYFDTGDMKLLEDFDSDTPYSIMFGPDRCGVTNKVHLIIRSQNPINKQWTEHHLEHPPAPESDTDSHIYTARLLPNDEYEMLIDNKSVKKGSMKTDFTPSFTPPEEINDPNDKKPEDWVDEASIQDPDAVKPDDWDENQPARIPDPEAKMPEGWLVDEPSEIENPDAVKPEDWDDVEDGEWSIPTIPNPACTIGCGEWTAPAIANPLYKGKWSAPFIDNPAYKGVWEPRKIPNEAYFVNDHPSKLSMNINALGFELWTMDAGILFDNIVVATNWDAVQQFINVTFAVRQPIEKSMKPEKASEADSTTSASDSPILARIFSYARENVAIVGATGLMMFVVVYVIFGRAKAILFPVETAPKKTSEVTPPSSERKADKADGGREESVESTEDEDVATSKTSPVASLPKAHKRAGNKPIVAD